jgi:hypothetical protein
MSGVPGIINDNPDAILPGESIQFPSPVINTYGSIQRIAGSSTQFALPPGGVYEITFQVPVSNAGELVVVLNGIELLYTVVGKPGSGLIVGMSIVATPLIGNSIITISNPLTATLGGLQVDNATGALTQPLSCHLIIKQLK